MWGLKGKVRRCDIRSTNAPGNVGKKWNLHFCELSPNGLIQKMGHQYGDGPKTEVPYDHHGFPIQETVRREFDSTGRLVRVWSGNRISETYEYHPSGGKKKIFYVERPEFHHTFGAEGSDAFYSTKGAATVISDYDQHPHQTRMTFYDAGGELLSQVYFLYDERGNLVREGQMYSSIWIPPEVLAQMNHAQEHDMRQQMLDLFASMECRHSYNDAGLRVASQMFLGSTLHESKSMTYTENGDVLHQVSESVDSRRSEYRFNYEYDALARISHKGGSKKPSNLA